jgi:xanthine dehydrogenase small subunit
VSFGFVANDRPVEAQDWALAPALDFIRGELGLTGTKEGCREGDCGACAVLVGERVASSEGGAVLVGERVASSKGADYRAMPSCLLALGELEGRHLVTIEGLAALGQTPVMRALAEENGSQCGFCSPGFVVSLTAYLANGDGPEGELSVEGAWSSVEGNLCRCTGYGSIKRAAERLIGEFAHLPPPGRGRLEALVAARALPPSCLAFDRGELLPAAPSPGAVSAGEARKGAILSLGGGTDFLVRNPEPEEASYPTYALLGRETELKRIEKRALRETGMGSGEVLEVGAAVSWREFFADPLVRGLVPGIERFEAVLASPLVRERATVGGNVANASPVGDLTAMLIALGASLRLLAPEGARELPLERLFLGYKRLDLRKGEGASGGEIIASILLPASKPMGLFNFEKISKRSRLDIASVNSGASFEAAGEGDRKRIISARISAGGVAPVPLLLAKASAFLEGKLVDAATALEASRIAGSEISPIGDVRGSADYRRRALERLVLAHFIVLFPGSGVEEAVS